MQPLKEDVKIGREVTVADLPDGYFKERLLRAVKSPESATVWAVAVLGTNRDYAVYVGCPHIDEVVPEHQENYAHYQSGVVYQQGLETKAGTSSNGDKVSEAEARSLFGDLLSPALRYRD